MVLILSIDNHLIIWFYLTDILVDIKSQQRSRQGAEQQGIRDKRKSIKLKIDTVSNEIHSAGTDSPYRSIEGVANHLVAPSPPDVRAKPNGRKRKSNEQIYREIEKHVEFRNIRERPPNQVQGFTKIDKTIVERTVTKEPFLQAGHYNSSSSSSSSSFSSSKRPCRPDPPVTEYFLIILIALILYF